MSPGWTREVHTKEVMYGGKVIAVAYEACGGYRFVMRCKCVSDLYVRE